MKTIPLTQGFVAQVDDADYEAVSAVKWYAFVNRRRVYAAREVNHKTVFLHQVLVGFRADHRDGDGLNNCRSNLRPATRAQNAQGFQRKRRGTSSKFRGVSWYAPRKKWKSAIAVEGRKRFLGYFHSEEEAARAYDSAAKHHFGEFASPNFPR